MRWEIKTKNPKIGDIRTVKKFAWFPVIALSPSCSPWIYRVWLETYIQEQMYVREEDMMGEIYYYWDKVKNYV